MACINKNTVSGGATPLDPLLFFIWAEKPTSIDPILDIQYGSNTEMQDSFWEDLNFVESMQKELFLSSNEIWTEEAT